MKIHREAGRPALPHLYSLLPDHANKIEQRFAYQLLLGEDHGSENENAS
jgi:hypothetical protein